VGQHRTRISRLQRHVDRLWILRRLAGGLSGPWRNRLDAAAMSPFDQARTYLARGIGQYGYDTCKWQAKVCLHNGNLKMAIWNTQVCLFIGRLRRVS